SSTCHSEDSVGRRWAGLPRSCYRPSLGSRWDNRADTAPPGLAAEYWRRGALAALLPPFAPDLLPPVPLQRRSSRTNSASGAWPYPIEWCRAHWPVAGVRRRTPWAMLVYLYKANFPGQAEHRAASRSERNESFSDSAPSAAVRASSSPAAPGRKCSELALRASIVHQPSAPRPRDVD